VLSARKSFLRRLLFETFEARQLLAVDIFGYQPDSGRSATDAITNASTASIFGNSEADAIVRILDSIAGRIAETTAASNGDWLVALPESLVDGTYVLHAESYDAGLNLLSVSSTSSLTLDRESPDAPAITLTRLPSAPSQYDFEFSGSAEADSLVEVFQNGFGKVGEAIADSSGAWSVTLLDASLANHRFEFSATATDVAGNQSVHSQSHSFRPNILFVMPDDVRPDELQHLPFVNSLVQSEAVNFKNAFVPTALCGPSRASILTGLNGYNTGIFGNIAPTGGGANLALDSTLPEWLKSVGYRTGIFGKGLTQPFQDAKVRPDSEFLIPPGWDEYFSLYNTSFYGASFNDNGVLYQSQPTDYQTDVLSDRTAEFIAPRSTDNSPFFAMFTPFAPHLPAVPEYRHRGSFASYQPPQSPAFNIPEAGKHPLSPAIINSITSLERQRLESLQSVDESLAQLYQQLEEQDQLDNTIIVFIGDNGFLLGEHALAGKNVSYDAAMRVPMFIWDGRQRIPFEDQSLSLSIDLAPTIAELAGYQLTSPVDGESLAQALRGVHAATRDDFLVSHVNYFAPPFGTEIGVRGRNWSYTERDNGQRLLFDLVNDPWQITNLAGNANFAHVELAMRSRLNELRPVDRQAPRVTGIQLNTSGNDASIAQKIRLQMTIDDSATGGSEVRTPEVYFNSATYPGTGIAVDTIDRQFDQSSEITAIDLPWVEIAKSVDPTRMYVRARDLVLNWSIPIAIDLSYSGQISLSAGSDTGASSTDKLTMDSTPTFAGTAVPNSQVTLFAINETTQYAASLGTVRCNALGNWSFTSNPMTAGSFTIIANVVDSTSSELSFLEPVSFRLIAHRDSDGRLEVQGSDRHDQIIVDTTSSGSAKVSWNGIEVGEDHAVSQIIMRGNNGNDYLKVDGPIPSYLHGGNGNDTLIGGSGNDELIGGSGDNQLTGSQGDDTYVFADLNVRDRSPPIDAINESLNGGFDSLSFTNQDSVYGGIDHFAGTFGFIVPNISWSRTISFPDVTSALSIERIVGAKQSTLRLPATVIFQGGRQDDFIHVINPVAPNQLMFVRNLSPGLIGNPNTQVVATIIATQGTIRVRTGYPTPTTAPRITNNGTGLVTLTGSLSSIRQTLQLSNGILFQANPGYVGDVRIGLQAYAISDPTAVERDSVFFHATHFPTLVTQKAASYIENAAPTLFAANAVVDDLDSNFNGMRLIATSTGFTEATDRLAILPFANTSNEVRISQNRVILNGIAMATIKTEFHPSRRLELVFNRNADRSSIQMILRRLSFSSSSEKPNVSPRTLTLRIIDGRNAFSPTAMTTIAVVAVNDRPTLNFGAASLSYKIGNVMPKILASDSTVADVDEFTGSFAQGYLVLRSSGFSNSTDQLSVNSNGTGVGQVQLAGNSVLYEGNIIGHVTSNGRNGTSLRIEWNFYANAKIIQAVVRRLTYQNISSTPVTKQRQLELILVDSTGLLSNIATKVITFTP
jgi:N-acetylglucosamine-6-sulfatase